MEPTEKKFAPIAFENLKRDDIIYLEDVQDADPYQIRDLGQPFILVENLNTHFCFCYHVVKPIFKLM